MVRSFFVIIYLLLTKYLTYCNNNDKNVLEKRANPEQSGDAKLKGLNKIASNLN